MLSKDENWHFSKRKFKINIIDNYLFLIAPESMLSKDKNWQFSKRRLKIKFFQIFLKNVLKNFSFCEWIQKVFIQNFIIAVLLYNFVDISPFLLTPKSMLSKDEYWHFSKRKSNFFKNFLKNDFKNRLIFWGA